MASNYGKKTLPVEDLQNAGLKSMPSILAMHLMVPFRDKYQLKLPYYARSPPPLLSLLNGAITVNKGFPQFKATDERDKIYALLGLADDRDELSIRVNYSGNYKPTDLYLDMSRTMLTNT
ncbi:hypothetical protein BDZ45DRAFT_750870 [Acephala macrosclerotiorum]|nr:hypothetical protein BDZ45DRAFT_750870 [Acephala macrosclerotiorum]